MADPAFPTRQYPYRRPDPTAGPEPMLAQALTAGTLYRFVVGLDPAPRPLTAEEIEALHDPFATGLLGRGSFPLTLRELLAGLDSLAETGLPVQDVYMVGDGGQLRWSEATAGVARGLRVTFTRRRTIGAEPDLLVSTSTALDSSQAFLQVVSWDETAGAFRFYERRNGTWLLAGSSWDALVEPSRGRGPFDSHINGALVMKELKPPWSHWHSQSATISPDVLAASDPFRNDPIWVQRKQAEIFEVAVARPGIFRWTQARLDRVIAADGTVSGLPQLLRQVVTTTTVNLVSTSTQSDLVARSARLELPATFFLDLDAFAGPLGLPLTPEPLTVSGPAYAAARTQLELHLTDDAGFTRPGETFFAFLVPERALEDLVVLEELITREVLSVRLATCLLMVDFSNPIWSQRRAALLSHVPPTVRAGAGAAALDQALPAAIEAGARELDGPEAEFLGWWDGSEQPEFVDRVQRRLLAYLTTWQQRLDAPDGAVTLLRLAQGRRSRFRRSTLAEFALTVPRSPVDDVAELLRVNADATIS